MIDALEFAGAKDMLRAEHVVHLRCEVTAHETPALTAANIERGIVRVISVMEYVPGHRQSRDIDRWDRAPDGGNLQFPRRGLPMFSHDDATIEHIHMARDEGISLAEFPVSLEAALKARAFGMLNVLGAPNMLRGGSQSGNIAISELIAAGLVDIRASDYVPRSMLDYAFVLARETEFGVDLPCAPSFSRLQSHQAKAMSFSANAYG